MIICRHTGEYYIGGTKTSFERRFTSHRASLRGGYAVPELQRCWNNSHPDWFDFIPLFECPPNEVRAREREAIAKLNPPLNRCRSDPTIVAAEVAGVHRATARSRIQRGADPEAPVYKRADVDGESLTLREVSERYGVPLALVRARYARGVRGRALVRPSYSRQR